MVLQPTPSILCTTRNRLASNMESCWYVTSGCNALVPVPIFMLSWCSYTLCLPAVVINQVIIGLEQSVVAPCCFSNYKGSCVAPVCWHILHPKFVVGITVQKWQKSSLALKASLFQGFLEAQLEKFPS